MCFLEGRGAVGGRGKGRTYDQSALVLGLSPLQADQNVLVDQFLEERPRVDGDEVHLVCLSDLLLCVACDFLPSLDSCRENARASVAGCRVGWLFCVLVFVAGELSSLQKYIDRVGWVG